MRTVYLVAAGLLTLAAVLPLSAQSSLGGFMNGGRGQKINYQPIDVSKATKNFVNGSKAISSPKLPTGPKLANFTPNVSFINKSFLPTGTGSRPIVPTSQNVFQPNPPKGVNWFASSTTK